MTTDEEILVLAQRRAVAALLEHVFATRAHRISEYDFDRFARVVAIWSE